MFKDFPKVILKSGRERSVERFHLWIFSGAIKNIQGQPDDGDIVEVYSNAGKYLATGHFQNGSIMVRIFSFQQTDCEEDFWRKKIAGALQYRQQLGFLNNTKTNVFRLIHGEGDGLPGLVADFYNGTIVLQAHSVGMFRLREMFAGLFMQLPGNPVKGVLDKSETTLNSSDLKDEEKLLAGSTEKVLVTENDNQFEVDVREGQKTGFFIDQRDNRKMLQQFCKDKKVANLFSYTGGFSVYAARGGARLIDTVDASEKAVQLAKTNMGINFGQNDQHRFYPMDVFDFLKNQQEKYDVIVLDPPAFAKHRQVLDNAIKAYRRLNEAAIRKLLPGGILFTFSCSQVVSSDDFRLAVFAAAASTGRQVRIVHQLGQPADHPVNLYHPEGQYLKGLILYVE
ncbi:MAG: class I SAM-dependent rRNA methyltransferase [Sphingobacteriia bacterium]|nr:class I SAM-dependent rRNA methyltransferase [Sphingobacteriia bacterium]